VICYSAVVRECRVIVYRFECGVDGLPYIVRFVGELPWDLANPRARDAAVASRGMLTLTRRCACESTTKAHRLEAV
jgi:hypothetical protein